jgi:hypothetical protein
MDRDALDELKDFIRDQVSAEGRVTRVEVAGINKRLDVLNGQVPKHAIAIALLEQRLDVLDRPGKPAEPAVRVIPEGQVPAKLGEPAQSKSFVAGLVVGAVGLIEGLSWLVQAVKPYIAAAATKP